jgi:hypothetical protein
MAIEVGFPEWSPIPEKKTALESVCAFAVDTYEI